MLRFSLMSQLLAGLTLMTAGARASVIYSGSINTNISHGAATNLTMAGANPFGFAIGVFGFQQGLQILFGGANSAVVGDPSQPAALNSGAQIGGSATYIDGTSATITMAATVPCSSFVPVCFPAGAFANTNGRFLGLRFNGADGQTRFGWARFDVTAGLNISATLIDYAYEDTPGVAILAGDNGAGPSSVPEPATAALLTLAITGLALRTRLSSPRGTY